MAGTNLGACTPASSPTLATQRTLIRVPASSRTRRNHGVFLVGDELATVCSSRREADGLGVLLQLGSGSLVLSGAMTPTQARAMAKALTAAAQAAETTQRGDGPHLAQQGGTA